MERGSFARRMPVGRPTAVPVKAHRFGGLWTEKKLRALGDYLTAYRRVLSSAKGRYFKTIYLDGFAGTGERADPIREPPSPLWAGGGLFANYAPPKPKLDEQKRGSVRVALELASPFEEYIFVDKSKARASQMSQLIATSYQHLADRCSVKVGDANVVIKKWCASTDWSTHRAVVFLDPYGLSVEWKTIECIAATQAIDLWILFPLGAGTNRLLTKGRRPPKEWGATLTKLFGTPSWQTAFYKEVVQNGLFYEERHTIKIANLQAQGQFFLQRLRSVFAGVAPRAMPLMNSRGNPLYLLCFAAGNPRGAPIAVDIANHLLKA